MSACVFEQLNRELRFVVKFFIESEEPVARISWLKSMKRGRTVKPGEELAKLTWGDGKKTLLKAPKGCKGKIAAMNRRIDHEDLDKFPSQWALRLKASGSASG